MSILKFSSCVSDLCDVAFAHREACFAVQVLADIFEVIENVYLFIVVEEIG